MSYTCPLLLQARQAVAVGDKTLAEARKTLDTLLTFDRHVQESREEAEYALRTVEEITRMVQTAEWQTQDARLALQGANRNASDARDIAIEAETVAEEVSREGEVTRGQKGGSTEGGQ